MNHIETVIAAFKNHVKNHFSLSCELIEKIDCVLQVDPHKTMFGDLSSNAALILAKTLKSNPRAVAETITQTFSHPFCTKMEIAGPGFINLFLTPETLMHEAQALFEQKDLFFKETTNKDIASTRYNIEFISANPTGPLHLGHGRGGIIGDVLGNVIRFLGYTVVKEHYINDAGVQMQKLGYSLRLRCQEALGESIQFPEDGYRGDYLKTLAQEAIAKEGKEILTFPDTFFVDYAYKTLLNHQKETLQSYGIIFDVWFSEKTLYPEKIKNAFSLLRKATMVYEEDGALWFKSTYFGDDKDRVLKKSDGSTTYAAADAAYLVDKHERGFNHCILVLGQDHDSYPKRLNGIRQALGLSDVTLDCIVYQLVSIKEGGQTVKLSKRAGRIVDLRDIIETVGPDIARFFYLNRKADAHLDFDIDLALSQTNDNPVYYLHYAYVRTQSIIEKAMLHESLQNITAHDALYLTQAELLLVKKIIQLKELLLSIRIHYQVHLLTYYLLELAEMFHTYYHRNRIIEPESINQSRGRLFLTMLVKDTCDRCLTLMGLSKPRSM